MIRTAPLKRTDRRTTAARHIFDCRRQLTMFVAPAKIDADHGPEVAHARRQRGKAVGIAITSREDEKRRILGTLSQLDERARHIGVIVLQTRRRHRTPVGQKYPPWNCKSRCGTGNLKPSDG